MYLYLNGVKHTVHDLLRLDARIQDLYFNISEMKLSITSLYIISDAPKYDIIWTENIGVIIIMCKNSTQPAHMHKKR